VEVGNIDAEALIYVDEYGRGAGHSSILKNIIVGSSVHVEKAMDQTVGPGSQNANMSLSVPTSNVIQWQSMIQVLGVFAAFAGVAGTLFMVVANSYLVRCRRRKQ
jgi:hypothetical protein